jgi:hypothetical protein
MFYAARESRFGIWVDVIFTGVGIVGIPLLAVNAS